MNGCCCWEEVDVGLGDFGEEVWGWRRVLQGRRREGRSESSTSSASHGSCSSSIFAWCLRKGKRGNVGNLRMADWAGV